MRKPGAQQVFTEYDRYRLESSMHGTDWPAMANFWLYHLEFVREQPVQTSQASDSDTPLLCCLVGQMSLPQKSVPGCQ